MLCPQSEYAFDTRYQNFIYKLLSGLRWTGLHKSELRDAKLSVFYWIYVRD